MDDLLHLARRMMPHAYAPYSKFHVGAAVRGEDGAIHGGCNVENAAYPQGLCAEAAAIAALVAAGQQARPRVSSSSAPGRRSSRRAAAAARSCASSRQTTCRSISAVPTGCIAP